MLCSVSEDNIMQVWQMVSFVGYTRKNLTSCQQVVLVTNLSTSWSDAVILSSCNVPSL